jgi:hypothetical protein
MVNEGPASARRAKTDDRVRPYIPMNGLYIRALAVAPLAARLHFDMKDTDLEGRESRRSRLISEGMASRRFIRCKMV